MRVLKLFLGLLTLVLLMSVTVAPLQSFAEPQQIEAIDQPIIEKDVDVSQPVIAVASDAFIRCSAETINITNANAASDKGGFGPSWILGKPIPKPPVDTTGDGGGGFGPSW